MADPTVWGPTCWRLVFTTCFRLERARCLALFDALRYLLPCIHCRRSYRLYLSQLDPRAAISDDKPHSAAMFAWAVRDHVNSKLRASHLPFSALVRRHELFGSPISRTDVADFLCCVATQVDAQDQVDPYERLAEVLRDALRACGEDLEVHLPLQAGHRAPSTLWLHALKVKNTLLRQLGFPPLTRADLLALHRPPQEEEAAPKRQHAPRTTRRRGTRRG